MSKIIKNAPSPVVVYARVARDEPGALDAQVSRLRQLAATHGWTDVCVIAEVRRHAISRMALRAVTEADVLVVRDLSRLTRQPRDVDRFMSSLAALGVQVVTAVDGPVPLDAGAALRRAILAHVLESGRAVHAERTRRGIAGAKARREEGR